ncbi:ATP-dependent Clp protease proteolytic subunit [Rhodococcus sp. T2V]|uniref:head maturation protease, ClpP-related n=1 Tax=Rhodococcus sp. T2V TaxID=3034164 RepID=UPI0023E20341|nr:head maturation protease, ClpP-related [Rhodococcus sp. T2V]MDF3309761.1 ATP-dependent Clp protease proteolytic subunit [Rhodococcus sp. T2V]
MNMAIRNGAGASSRSRDWCQINAQAGAATEIMIYGVIGSYWMETDAQTVATQIKALDTDEIVVRINSPGGAAFDGIAIMNALRSHEAKVIVYIDGLAASAASVVAMAGDEIIMGEGSQMMIHEAWMYTEGDAAGLRADADRLDKLSDSLTAVYARRAGGEVDEWRALVAAETWFTAEEAVAAGLADRVSTDAAVAGELAAAFNLSRFRFAGREHAPAPRVPSAEAVEVTNRKEGDMPTLKETLAQRLGTAADADDATVVAALDEVLAEQAQEPAGPASNRTAGETTAEQVANYASQHGLVVVDRAQHEDYVAAANEGRAARAQQIREGDESLVEAAIRAGKFGPGRRDHWLNSLRVDREGATEAINSLASGLVPLAEVGHGVDPEPTGDTDFTSVDKFNNWIEEN